MSNPGAKMALRRRPYAFTEQLAAMEKKYDQRFKIVFDILKQLTEPPPDPPKRPMGFIPPESGKK